MSFASSTKVSLIPSTVNKTYGQTNTNEQIALKDLVLSIQTSFLKVISVSYLEIQKI